MSIDVQVNGSENQVFIAGRDLSKADLQTSSPPVSIRVAGLRTMGAQYWQPAIGIAAGIYGALTAVSPVTVPVPLVASSSAGQWTAIGTAVAVLLLIRHPRVVYGVMRWLAPVERPPENRRGFRGLLPYTEGEKIPGRAHETEQCRVFLQRGRFVVLDGETGCGKTSVLAAALLPAIRESARVVEVRVGERPFHSLYRALSKGPVPAQVGRAQILDLLAGYDAAAEAHPLVIVIDQFEELFVLVREGIRRRFAVTLRDVVETGAARVVVALRSDFLDLLVKLCREADPAQHTLNLSAWYTLKAFRESVACEVVQEILAEFAGDDARIEHEVQSLAKTLAHDLLRAPRDARLSPQDPWTVLPVELQSVGLTLQLAGTRNLTTDGYRRLGGRAGLMRALIEDTKRFVRLSTGADGETTLLILREFMSSAGTRQPRTVAELKNSKVLSALPNEQIKSILAALEQRFLVKRVAFDPSECGDGAGAYELVHEYLVRILRDAPDPFLQKARDAQERLQFWLTRAQSTRETQGRFAQMLDQPIPLVEALRLRRFASTQEARRMLNDNLAAYASRVGLVSLPLLLACSVGWAWWSAGEHQVELALSEGRAAALKVGAEDLTPWLVALGETGLTDEAVRASEAVQSQLWRGFLLTSAADSLLTRSQLSASAELLRAAMKVGYYPIHYDQRDMNGDPYLGDTTLILTRAAQALARNGRALEGSQLPNSGSTPFSRANGFAAVALGLDRAGYHKLATEALRKAREACAEIPGGQSRVDALGLIVRIADLTAHPAEARAAASDLWVAAPLVEDEWERFSARMAYSAASARLGDTQRARAAFKTGLAALPKWWRQNRDLQMAVRDLARAGQLSWTLQNLRELPQSGITTYIRVGAVAGLTEAGQVDSALSLVSLLATQDEKLEALIAISMVLPQNRRSLAFTISEIVRMERDSPTWVMNQHKLMSLVDTLIAAGSRGTALELASRLPDDLL